MRSPTCEYPQRSDRPVLPLPNAGVDRVHNPSTGSTPSHMRRVRGSEEWAQTSAVCIEVDILAIDRQRTSGREWHRCTVFLTVTGPSIAMRVALPKSGAVLAILAGSASFLLFGLLKGVVTGFDEFVEAANDRRMSVVNRTLISYGLPLAHMETIRNIEGVAAVTFSSRTVGEDRDTGEPVTAVTVNNDDYFTVFPEVLVTADELAAFWGSPTGVLVGRHLAETYGWETGDQVRLFGISSRHLEVVGKWDAKDPSMSTRHIFTRDTLNTRPSSVLSSQRAARGTGTDMILEYSVLSSDTRQPHEVASRIDATFSGSDVPTRTRTERQSALTSVYHQIGDLRLLADAVVACSLCIFLLGLGVTLARSARDRLREVALRGCGYGRNAVAATVFAEALAICLCAATLGLTLARLVAPPLFVYLNLELSELPTAVYPQGFAVALIIAVASSILPAMLTLYTYFRRP